MTRTLSSFALLLAIALGIAPSGSSSKDLQVADMAAPRTAPDGSGSIRGVGRHASADVMPGDSGQVHDGPVALRLLAGVPTGSLGTALIGGWISWADPDLGGDYLATRFPRGTLVKLCTPNRCIVRRSNDFGPSAKIDPPRIADLAVLDWESLCGLPRARGVCRGTVEAIGEIALPATDVAP